MAWGKLRFLADDQSLIFRDESADEPCSKRNDGSDSGNRLVVSTAPER